MAAAGGLITDSCDPEEAPLRSMPCTPLRLRTEWHERLQDGRDILVGDPQNLVAAMPRPRLLGPSQSPFADGAMVERVAAEHVPRSPEGNSRHQRAPLGRGEMQSRGAGLAQGKQESHRGGNLHVWPNPIVNASRLFKQTLSVARSGLFSSVIICGHARAGLSRQKNLPHGRRIDRVGAIVHDRQRTVAGKMLEQLSWSVAVFRRYSHSDICVINAHSVAVLPVCYLLSRRLGAKLIYDTHELETETGTSKGMQRWIFKVIERAFIAKCDAVFVVNQSIADWYRQRYRGLHPVVVRNISDTETSGRPADLRAMLSVPANEHLFIFSGNLGEGRNIRAILDAFAAPAVNAHVVFLTGGGKFDSLVSDYCARYSNVHRLPAVPPTEVVHYVAGCDVGLCLIQPSCLSRKLSLPNKAFEYAQAWPAVLLHGPARDRSPPGTGVRRLAHRRPGPESTGGDHGADDDRHQSGTGRHGQAPDPELGRRGRCHDGRVLCASGPGIERSREGPGGLGTRISVSSRQTTTRLPKLLTCLPPMRRRS